MKQATLISFILIWSVLKSFAQMPLSGNLVAGEASFVDKESGEKKVYYNEGGTFSWTYNPSKQYIKLYASINSFDKEINGLYINLTKISQTSSNSPIYIFKPSSDVMFSFYVHPKDNDVIIVVMETKNVICSFWNDRYAEN